MLLLTGCVLTTQAKLEIEYGRIEGAPELPAVDPDQVAVFEQLDDLPEGITMATGRGKASERLAIEPDFPTAEAPHRLIGGVAASQEHGGRDKLLAAARAEAARHGANAIVIVKLNHDRATALALHLSAARSTEEFPTADDLLAHRPPEAKGFAPRGAPTPFDLEAPAPFEYAVSRGECFALQLVLEPSARIRPSLSTLGANREDGSGVGYFADGAPRVNRRQRGYVFLLGCAEARGKHRVTIGHGALGRGAAKLRLLHRRASEAEMRQREQKQRELMDDARQRNSEQAGRACRACLPHLLRCSTPELPASCVSYKRCLSQRYTRLDACQ